MEWRAQGCNVAAFKYLKSCHSEEAYDLFCITPEGTHRQVLVQVRRKCLMIRAAQMWNKIDRSIFLPIKPPLSPLSVLDHSGITCLYCVLSPHRAPLWGGPSAGEGA